MQVCDQLFILITECTTVVASYRKTLVLTNKGISNFQSSHFIGGLLQSWF